MRRARQGSDNENPRSEPFFKSIEEYVEKCGGTKVIKKVLIANNGIAAIKGIRSIRQWAYDMFFTEKEITFVVMATPEDVAAGAEFIKIADESVEVPGGSNKNNFANVKLVVEVAKRTNCDAVWVGWGHASENPELAEALVKNKIVFLGPPANAMRDLGDKITSTIIAQTLDVPCIPWSGSHVKLPPGVTTVPSALAKEACISDASKCKDVCSKIGYPLMLKASEGGGGKGIRMVKREEDVVDAYIACQGEVPNSPIFAMKLATNVRHLEVQLLADMYGNVTALFTRDCSVQRRHQKIIEEGPVLQTQKNVLPRMESCAKALAKLVGYVNAGTVEFLYSKEEGTFYFLELNPRLQVEHPVTECITNVNLPACQLQVGMGIPLNRISYIRSFYKQQDMFGDSPIDFDGERQQPDCHTIAVRITAEDPDEGFRPSTGAIHELNFRPSKTVWGYFSLCSHSSIHEFADSQFGHIFASGPSREDARKAMVVALRQLTIKGEIMTNVEYVTDLLERPEFKNLDISTSWLDTLILRKVRTGQPNKYLAVICAAIFKVQERWDYNKAAFIQAISVGHVPHLSTLATSFTETLVLNHWKYVVTATKIGLALWDITLNGSHIQVGLRRLKDRGMLVYLENRSFLLYAYNDPNGLRLNIDGKTAVFSNDVDPTKQRAAVPGKLVRFLVKDGDYVLAETPYAEVEVMKMHLQLKTQISGKIHLRVVPGTTITAGKLLAEIEPEQGTAVATVEEFSGKWPTDPEDISSEPQTLGRRKSSRKISLEDEPLGNKVQNAISHLYWLMKGYDYPLPLLEEHIDRSLDDLMCLAQWGNAVKLYNLKLPMKTQPDESVDKSYRSQLLYIVTTLVDEYLEVAKLFDHAPDEQVLEELRDEHKKEAEWVFEILLAHNGKQKHRVLNKVFKRAEDNGILGSMKPMLENLCALKSKKEALVVFQARHMLRKFNAPSFTERKEELRKQLDDFAQTGDERILHSLVGQSSVSFELIASFFNDPNQQLQCLAFQLFIRRTYSGSFNVSDVKMMKKGSTWIGSFQCTLAGGYNHEGIVGGASYDDLESFEQAKALPFAQSGGSLQSDGSHEEMDIEKFGNGFMVVFASLEDLRSQFDSLVVDHFAESDELSQAQSVVEVLLLADAEDQTTPWHELFQGMVENAKHKLLRQTQLLRLTFLVIIRSKPPVYYTYRRKIDFQEDRIYRNVAPTYAYLMELWKLKNYDIQLYPLSNPRIHLYWAREKANVRKKNERASVTFREKRFFVRVLLLGTTMGSKGEDTDEATLLDATIAENLLVEAMSSLEIAMADDRFEGFANHIFINMVDGIIDTETALSVIGKLHSRYAPRLLELDVLELEARFCTRTKQGTMPVRVYCRNPTKYLLHIDMFCEIPNQEGGRHLLVPLYSSNSNSFTPSSPTTPDHHKVLYAYDPYPLLSVYTQKRLDAHRQHTNYVYDWPLMFEVAVRDMWKLFAQKRTDTNDLADKIPNRPIQYQELIMDSTMTKLEPTDRPKGTNNIGMVVWKMTLHLPSRFDPHTDHVYPKHCIVVANDVTFQSGSFAVEEDACFGLACKYARERNVPLVYVACNSGARIGLATEVKDIFKVVFTDEDAPEKGFQYLYVTEEDYEKLTKNDRKSLSGEKIERNGQVIFKIKDIIGKTNGIGVENLVGSGLIAGEMSKCFATIPTISIATGRSVGIGAYLNRLGRRVVQTKNSPIILTGFQALNKLLGRDVYISHNQLGGHMIMSPNGVTHWEVADDAVAVRTVVEWLDFLPEPIAPIVFEPIVEPEPAEQLSPVTPPHLPRLSPKLKLKTTKFIAEPRLPLVAHFQVVEDTWDRPVEFVPKDKHDLDPRLLIKGITSQGKFSGGLFDRDSFRESLQHWAKTVVVGRAKLGGMPVGIITAETRSVVRLHPADPADPSSCETQTTQAGCVWFPDSARKTADALGDFQQEGLPCFILANWRGFSGGMRDMFDEVLKFGADIVDRLREYRHPVFIYIPPLAELRGGAWVVLDTQINADCIEMYSDVSGQANVLEPPGLIEIKFRDKDIIACMHRLDHQCISLLSMAEKCSTPSNQHSVEKERLMRELKTREEMLFPTYKSIALQFAALHDTAGTLKAKAAIREVVPWENSRRYFYLRLRRRTAELFLLKQLQQINRDIDLKAAKQLMSNWMQRESPAVPEDDDTKVVAWLDSFIGNGREGSGLKRALDEYQGLMSFTQLKDFLESLDSIKVQGVTMALQEFLGSAKNGEVKQELVAALRSVVNAAE